MLTIKKILAAATLTAMAFSAGIVGQSALAQAPAPGQPGGGFGGRGGGQGGRAGRTPMTMGTVVSGNLGAGTVTINSQFGGGQTTIHVSKDTKIVSQLPVKVSDLRVGDKVQIQGIPTGISASTIVAGDMPDFLPGANRGARPGAGAPGAAPADPNAPPAANTPQLPPPANASATGTVTSISESGKSLTIAVGDSISIKLSLAADAKITKMQPIAFDALRAGDTIIATGQPDANGLVEATGVAVNVQMGGRGGIGGGFGGGFGGGGFGRGFNGGGANGANGANGQPGGGRGGRRNRGGGNNGQPGQDPQPGATL